MLFMRLRALIHLPRGPLYGLTPRDVKRIANDDLRPLKAIPSTQWLHAVHEVPRSENVRLEATLAVLHANTRGCLI